MVSCTTDYGGRRGEGGIAVVVAEPGGGSGSSGDCGNGEDRVVVMAKW